MCNLPQGRQALIQDAGRRWLRGYFWRSQILQLVVVVALMAALNVATCAVTYMVAHSNGYQKHKELQGMATTVFSDYLSAGTPFCIDSKDINFVRRSSYNTYTIKRPKDDMAKGGKEQ